MDSAYMIRVGVVNMTYVNTICDAAPMDTMGERLRHAREMAGFASAMAAAKRFGWATSTYAAHENGQNGFPVDSAERYGRAFRVSSAWLLTGEGETARRNIVKVQGLVGAGGSIDTGVESVGPEGIEEIELPFALEENAVAYQVKGDSMFPRYDDGDIIIVIVREQSPDDLLYEPEALVTTTKGNRYLKRIAKGSRKGRWNLMSHNAPAMLDVRLASASGVHVVVRRGKWQKLDTAGKKRAVKAELHKR